MIEKLKALCIKYREIIVYIIVGGLTTIVSWAVCFLMKFLLDTNVVWQNSLVTTIGWIAGVAFAFPTNRKWVFQSTSPNWGKELIEFVSSRIATYVLELVLMDIAVNLIGMHCGNFGLSDTAFYWISKVIVSVFVVVANYVLSKLWVFRKKKS